MSGTGTVVCTATHPIDIDTGQTLSPGESAVDVDTTHPHNAALILDRSLVVTEGTTPRKRRDEQLGGAPDPTSGHTDERKS